MSPTSRLIRMTASGDGPRPISSRAVLKGTSPAGAHYFPAFPYTSYQHAKIEDVRDLFAYLKTLAPVSRQGARSRRAVSVQHPPQCRGLEMAVHGRQAVRAGCLRNRRNGIAAPISSTASAIARNVTARAISSAASSAAQRFAGGPNPEGEGWVPNITQKGLGGVEREGYRLFPRNRADARRRQRRRLDGARDQEHLAIGGRRIARRWRNISSRCRRSRGRRGRRRSAETATNPELQSGARQGVTAAVIRIGSGAI